MNYDDLKLRNQLCFPLYAASRELIKHYREYLEQIGLTYTQYIAMLVLWEERRLNVKALGKRLYLDSGTLTPLLKKLEEKGLVTRRRSDEDERNLIVTLTAKGDRMKDEALHIPGEMAKCLRVDGHEIHEIYRIMYKMLEYVKE